MKIVVFGTGFVGSALIDELVERGHQVTAVSRTTGRELDGVDPAAGSVYDERFVTEVTTGAEVVVAALPALDSEGGLAAAVTSLATATEHSGARIGVVSGAAILPLDPQEPRLGDSPDFPAALRPLVDAHQRALDALRATPKAVDWFALVPAAEFGPDVARVQTGTYRTSSVALVSNENRRSFLSVDDYAIAFADEIETPRTHRAWLAIGY